MSTPLEKQREAENHDALQAIRASLAEVSEKLDTVIGLLDHCHGVAFGGAGGNASAGGQGSNAFGGAGGGGGGGAGYGGGRGGAGGDGGSYYRG